MKRRFFFFLERELHLPMLVPLMEYIHDIGLGEIGIGTVEYFESREGIPGRGLRKNVLHENVRVPFEMVDDPYAWQPDITFMADFSYQYVEGLGKIVNIGHGTISKGWFFTDKLISRRENCADLMCVPGTIHKQVLEKQVKVPIEVTGMAKLDSLFMGEWNRAEVLRMMGLNPDNKTILFAPTFNRELSIVPHIRTDFRKYLPDYLNIIIKLHGAAPEEWKREYRSLADHDHNMYYSESMDIAPSFAASDLLITDVSSVIYEFAALGKPVVLFDSPTQKDYPNFASDDLEYRFRDVGTRIRHVGELQERVFNLLLRQAPTAESQEIANQFISVRDGTSAEKIVSHALNLLHQQEPRGTILIDNPEGYEISDIFKKYENRFDILMAGTGNGDAEIESGATRQQTIFNALDKIRTNTFIYADARWEFSPMMACLLSNHLMLNDRLGLVIPLCENSEDLTLQQLRFHVRVSDEMPKHLIGWQLTYAMTGQWKEIPYLETPVFASRKEIWENTEQFTNCEKKTLSWLEMFRSVQMHGRISALALDSYITRKQISMLEKIGGFTFPGLQFNDLDSKTPDAERQTSSALQFVEEDEPRDENEDVLLSKIAENPSDTELIKRYIRYLFSQGKYEKVDVYEAMIPHDPEVALMAAIALDKQDFYDQALEKIDTIDTLSLIDRTLLLKVLTLKAKLLIKLSRASDALGYVQEAYEIDDTNPDILITLGSCLLILNQPEKALPLLERAEEIAPGNVQVQYGIASIYLAKGDLDRARVILQDIAKRNPDNLSAVEGLMNIAYRTRDFNLVIEPLSNYIARHPESINIRFVAAGIYFESGRYDDALKEIQQIEEVNPDFVGVEDLKQRILAAR